MGEQQYHRGEYPPAPRRDARYFGHGAPDHYGSPGGYPSYRHEGIKQERDIGGYDRRPLDPGPPMSSIALKAEIKQEEPDSGYGGPPKQFPNRKRSHEDRGRGFYEHRQDDRRARSPQATGGLDEDDVFDESVVVLDNYNSDLHFKLDKDRTMGFPLTLEGFAYLWSGARATHGVTRGKVVFEMRVKEEIAVGHLPASEPDPHVVRVGWSLDSCSTQLGEEPFSYGYGGTGKKSTNSKFENYGEPFAENDVIGCFLDFEARGGDIEMSFSKNGRLLGVAYRIRRDTVEGKALFPHILVKNCAVEFNFGQRAEPFSTIPPGFTFIQQVASYERVRGALPPKNKGECEMLMMVGLPGAGKTTWALKHAASHPAKKYNILGTNTIMEKMRVMGLRRQRNYAGRWDVLIQQATGCLNKLIQIAARRKRNYILDQTNVYGTAQKRKMRPFEGFQRKAIIICPTDEDLLDRIVKRTDEEGKDVPDSAVLEMKANFSLPEARDFLDEVVYVELQKEEAEKLVRQYNEEGKKAGPPPEKRFRGRGGGGPHGGGRGRGDGGRGGGAGGGTDYQRFDNRDAPVGSRGGFQGRGGPSGGSYRGGGGGGGGFSRGGQNTPSRWSGSPQDNGSESRGGFGRNSQEHNYSPVGNQSGGYGSGGSQSHPSSSSSGNYNQMSQSYGQGSYGQGSGGGSYGQGSVGGGYTQSSGGSSYSQGSSGGGGYGQSSGGGGYGQSSGGGSYGQSSGGGSYGQSSTGGSYGQSSTGSSYGQSSTGGSYGQSSTGGSYGQSSTGGNYGQSSTGGSYGQSSTGGSYGQSSTGGSYGQSSTGGSYGQSSTGGSYGQSSTGGSYGQSSTGGSYGQSSTGGSYGQSSTGGGYGQSSTGGGYGQSSGSTYSQSPGGGYSQSPSGGGYTQGSGGNYSQSYGGQSYSQGYSQPPPAQSSSPAQPSYGQQYQQQPYGQQYQYQGQGSTQSANSPVQNQGPGQYNYGSGSGSGGAYEQSGRYGGGQ